MSPVKETNFFCFEGETLYFRGPGDQNYINRCSITKIEDYLNLFQGVDNQVAIVRHPLYHPKTPKRIQNYIPDAKLIVILQSCIAYSSFCIWFVMVVNHLEIKRLRRRRGSHTQ